MPPVGLRGNPGANQGEPMQTTTDPSIVRSGQAGAGRPRRNGAPSLIHALAASAVAAAAAPAAQAGPGSLVTASAWQALQAVAAMPPSAAGVPRFAISRFVVEGASLVPAQDFEAALARFTGEQRTFADIEAAAEAVRAVYERAGIASVEVTVPEQALVQGVVRLKVEELRLARVEIAGAQQRSPENVRRAVPGLAEGRTPSDVTLSRQLRLANENPGRQMQVTLRTEPDGQLTAVLRVADRPALIGQVSVDNTGTPSTGRMRMSLAVQHMNLLDRDIVATAQFQTSPEFFDEVRVASVSARVPLYATGLMLEGSVVHSSVDSGTVRTVAGEYLLSSSGLTLSLRLVRLLHRWGTVEPRVWAGLESKLVQSSVTTSAGGPSLVPDIELRPMQLGLAAAWRGQAAALNGQVVAMRNVPGSGRSAPSVFASPGLRAGANPNYSLVRASASATRAWEAGTALAQWSGQWTRDALVSAEQFGIGGEGSVRGFDGRLVTGDIGQRLSLEWQTPPRTWGETSSLEVSGLVFADAGRVRRLQALPGEATGATLAGAGIGVRVFRPRSFSVRLDIGAAMKAEGVASTRTGFVHAGAEYPL
jgi:hemolysin activation/secretion protein